MRKTLRLIPLIVGLLVLAVTAPILAQTPDASDAGERATEQLTRQADGHVFLSVRSNTGVASSARVSQGGDLMPGARSDSARGKSAEFFNEYGAMFGVSDPAADLALVNERTDSLGNTHLDYQQNYQGENVFGGMLKTHFDSELQLTSVNGVFVPDVRVGMTPLLSVQEAEARAVAKVTDQRGVAAKGAAAVDSQLTVYRTGLVQGVAGFDHLVYEVEVTNPSISIREFIFVDAYSGKIVDQFTGIYHDLDREVSEDNLDNVVWAESNSDPNPIPSGWGGGSPDQVSSWQDEVDGAGETYHLFASMGGWDSYDNAGSTMRTVNNDPTIFCPNANWNGTSTNYCDDVTGDDTVAHEWGHAYTENTNNLIYAWQSGALNESYSDIWGEAVDFLNGRGLDTPDAVRASNVCSSNAEGANLPGNPTIDTVRWLSGENDPAFSDIPAGSGNAIRDLWDPTCFGDPGKVTDTEYWCATDDGGGVHTNSGVPNHAFALLVDGGTYNGQTVNAIGITKAAHIHWYTQENILINSSNFSDHADGLAAACTALTGVNLNSLSTSDPAQSPSGEAITSADCQEVAKAIDAVEFRTDTTPICDFKPLLDSNAPALCADPGDLNTIEMEDWESGSLPDGWSVGTRDVASPPNFVTPDWAVVDNLPSGAVAGSTHAAFVADIIEIGDCAADDVSGVLYLEGPEISIPAGAMVPRLAFDHWVATEMGWDGGNIRVSVNGGPWTLIPRNAFDFNRYNSMMDTVADGNTNPLAGEYGFTGTDGGSVSGSWGQSQVNLSAIAAPGDTVKVRFEFGQDGCNGLIGWYVDDVHSYYCAGEEPEPMIAVDPDSIVSLQSPDQVVTETLKIANVRGATLTWEIDEAPLAREPFISKAVTPSGLTARQGQAAVPDWTEMPQNLPVSAVFNNLIVDGGFEAGPFGGAWDEDSTNFGTVICDADGCGTGGGTGPLNGDYWAWFGGISVYEEGSVAQDVIIPAGDSAELSFYLEQPLCDSGSDYMEVTMDGNQLFLTDGDSELCGTIGYTLQTVDVTAYADDASHRLEFHSETFANNGGETNFFVDDVAVAGPSICNLPSDAPWLTVTPNSGSSGAGSSTNVDVILDATGLALGTYRSTLCVTSNDSETSLVEVPVELEVAEIPPQISVSAVELMAEHTTDPQSTQMLGIVNVGGPTLTWSIEEVTGSASRLASLPATAAVSEIVKRSAQIASSVRPDLPHTLSVPGVTNNLLLDGGFEAGPNGGVWDEFSSNFGTPISDGGVFGFGPASGRYWVWFGGIDTEEEGSVAQDVTIGITSTAASTVTLSFYLAQPDCDSEADYMEVTMDGTQVYKTDGSSQLCTDVISYTLQTVDLTAYADGAEHRIEFHSEIFANNGGGSNFFLDDVALAGPSICDDPSDIPWLSTAPSSGALGGDEQSDVIVAFDSTGMENGSYEGTLCVASNDSETPLLQVPVTLNVDVPTAIDEPEEPVSPSEIQIFLPAVLN